MLNYKIYIVLTCFYFIKNNINAYISLNSITLAVQLELMPSLCVLKFKKKIKHKVKKCNPKFKI